MRQRCGCRRLLVNVKCLGRGAALRPLDLFPTVHRGFLFALN
jgi:hypothetical protein